MGWLVVPTLPSASALPTGPQCCAHASGVGAGCWLVHFCSSWTWPLQKTKPAPSVGLWGHCPGCRDRSSKASWLLGFRGPSGLAFWSEHPIIKGWGKGIHFLRRRLTTNFWPFLICLTYFLGCWEGEVNPTISIFCHPLHESCDPIKLIDCLTVEP